MFKQRTVENPLIELTMAKFGTVNDIRDVTEC